MASVAAGFEGIMLSQLARTPPAQPGRSDAWRKVKALASEEFAVVGHTSLRGSRHGIGALGC